MDRSAMTGEERNAKPTCSDCGGEMVSELQHGETWVCTNCWMTTANVPLPREQRDAYKRIQ